MNAYYNWLNSLVTNNKNSFSEFGELKWLNARTAPRAQQKRDDLLRQLDGNLLFKDTKPFHKQLSQGCKLCGLGRWSCLFITGKCNAACFYCPAPQDADDVPTTQNLKFPDPLAYAEYVDHFIFKGVSFSGGEPLLYFERTLEYLKAVRKKCDPGIYTWMYTNGILADTQKFRKLAAAGLNEVRFDIGATAFKLDKISSAKGIVPNITIEIPAVPEEKERLMKMLPEMIKAGVNNLNLHQLRLTKYNAQRLKKRNYTYIQAEHPIVLESELAALEIINYAHEHNIDIGINYCSFFFKSRFQKAGFRNRLAAVLGQDNDEVSENGYLRQRDGQSIAYRSLRLLDEKPALLPADEIKLNYKSYFLQKETAMKSTQLDEEDNIRVDSILTEEPTEIPNDPLLFRIWQMEYIERGLREY